MQNNYMLQVQTLINQKSIEAPGAKKHVGDYGKMVERVRGFLPRKK